MRGALWETVIDVQIDLRRWFSTHEGWLAVRNDGPVEPDGTVQPWLRADRTQPDMLLVADAVWISADVAAIVSHAEKTFAPEPLAEADLLTPSGFAVLEAPVPLTDPADGRMVGGDASSSMQVRACTWHVTTSPDGRRGVVWALYIPPTHPDVWGAPFLPFFDSNFWSFGAADSTASFTRWLQCLWRFMLQTITVVASEPPPRAVRRRMERANWTQRTVQVVTLRRKRVERQDGQDEYDADRQFSCRWLVNGHWRNQWFPSLEDHRQIWIDPYVKGPDGAPFKRPARRSLMVTR